MSYIQDDMFPDEASLQALANEFFKAVPGEAPKANAPALSPASNTYAQVNHPDAFNINDPQTSLPDPHFYNGQIPRSVAGSGKSPSLKEATSQGSKAAPVQHTLHSLPFTDTQSIDQQIQQVFKSFSSFPTGSQLPLAAFGNVNPASYYFMPEPVRTQLPAPGHVKPPFDINRVKADFPILKERVHGKQLVWLDNAATTQKPKFVIDRISAFYEHENSNIHRAAHDLAARATDAYEGARSKVQHFLNAASPNEIVFVRGTTEGINLVAQTWGEQHLREGDEIIVSHLEHHANIVPWQLLAKQKGFAIKVIPVDDDGQIILEEYAKLLNRKTKLVSFTQVSNALGTITPARVMIEMAHAAGARVLLDGAQSVSHMRVDVQELNPDFFVFSGHKIFGPTGIGVVYGKEALLNQLPPWQGGGNMIKDVTFEHTVFHDAPGRFEAGTGNIADAVGLGAAIDYVTSLGMDLIAQYEHGLLLYGTQLLKQVPGLKLIGTAADKASVLSFTLDGYSNDEVGKALNQEGVAVRTGHHCAQPILRRFGVETTVRPSLAFYNTCSDLDTLAAVLHRLKDTRRR
jgi:cysteine desulfurase / selenocysteine lyase